MKHCVKVTPSTVSTIKAISESKFNYKDCLLYPFYCPETDMFFTERVARLYKRVSSEEFLNLDIVRDKLYKAFHDSLEN